MLMLLLLSGRTFTPHLFQQEFGPREESKLNKHVFLYDTKLLILGLTETNLKRQSTGNKKCPTVSSDSLPCNSCVTHMRLQ